MTTITSSISLYADDISTSDFSLFINGHYPNDTFETVISNHQKEGRSGLGDFLLMVSKHEIAVGLFVNMLYDLLKFGFSKLKEIPDSEAFAIVTMQNGMVSKIPMSLSNEEIRLEIVLLLSKGDIKSIEFDC